MDGCLMRTETLGMGVSEDGCLLGKAVCPACPGRPDSVGWIQPSLLNRVRGAERANGDEDAIFTSHLRNRRGASDRGRSLCKAALAQGRRQEEGRPKKAIAAGSPSTPSFGELTAFFFCCSASRRLTKLRCSGSGVFRMYLWTSGGTHGLSA